MPQRARRLSDRGELTYYSFPEEHWQRIRTNNPLERILREIRRRTRVVGAFPDGQSALNVAAVESCDATTTRSGPTPQSGSSAGQAGATANLKLTFHTSPR